MAYKNPPGCVNYKPNSLDRNNPQEAPMPCYPGMRYPGGTVQRSVLEKTDDYSQARTRYRSLPRWDDCLTNIIKHSDSCRKRGCPKQYFKYISYFPHHILSHSHDSHTNCSASYTYLHKCRRVPSAPHDFLLPEFVPWIKQVFCPPS